MVIKGVLVSGCCLLIIICHLKTKINKLETTENPLSAKRSFWLVRYVHPRKELAMSKIAAVHASA